MSRFRRSVALLAAVGLVAVAGGCGGAETTLGGKPLTAEQLAQSASASVAQQSSRFAFDFDLTAPGAPGPFDFSGEGAFDPKAERATMTVDFSSLAQLLGGLTGGLGGLTPGQGAPDFSDPEAWKIDLIVDGKTAYMRFPAFASELPEGKTWVKLDTKDGLKTTQGLGLSGLDDFTNGDPRELLDVLESVSGEVETVGTEELRGTPTTHYRATVDLTELDRFTPKSGGQDLGDMIDKALEQTGLSEMPFDVWLDDEGLIRKVAANLSIEPPGQSEKAEAGLSFELFDYGLEVDVTPPPADQVADASVLK
jgi:hypothetical protein